MSAADGSAGAGALLSSLTSEPHRRSAGGSYMEDNGFIPQLDRGGSGSFAHGGPLLAAGAEALRMELRMKMTEISALEARVKELTLTRDQ